MLGFGISEIMAVSVSRPYVCCLSKVCKEFERSRASVSANFLKYMLERPSGPGRLWGLSVFITRRTSSNETGHSIDSWLASDNFGMGISWNKDSA